MKKGTELTRDVIVKNFFSRFDINIDILFSFLIIPIRTMH